VADQLDVGQVGLTPNQTELAGEVIEHKSSRIANPADSPSLLPTVGSN
jgi:hypothetical protein